MNNLESSTSLHDGRYVIGDVLGVGGFGITYAAFDTVSQSDVAIKEYMPSKLAERNGCDVTARSGSERDFADGFSRFSTEWEMLAVLSNIKSIVRVLDFFHENSTSYIVMELLTGEDVKSLLSKIPEKEILPFCEMIVEKIGSALIEVHNRGIIHLDVSPANIFFQSDGRITLIDFGSAVYVNNSDLDTVQLKHGFAPPELYNINSPKGPWTDIYALAATYYNLVSDTRVTPAHTRLKNDDLQPLSALRQDVPRHISDSIQRALSLDLNYRYKSVLEFLNDFSNIAPYHPAYGREDRFQDSSSKNAGQNQKKSPAGSLITKFNKLISRRPSIPIPFAQELSAATRQAAAPKLIAYSSRYGHMDINMNPGVVYKIGRFSGSGFSDFVISDDPRISKIHLSIKYDPMSRAFVVTDFSANGTFLDDGSRIIKGVEYKILPNSVIHLASRECSIEFKLS